MNESTRQRLLRCFAAVFDQIEEKDLPLLRMETSEAWDSLAHVMLMSVVQQEFSVDISLEEARRLNSFESLLERIQLDGAEH
jgi:acyl carrier protein